MSGERGSGSPGPPADPLSGGIGDSSAAHVRLRGAEQRPVVPADIQATSDQRGLGRTRPTITSGRRRWRSARRAGPAGQRRRNRRRAERGWTPLAVARTGQWASAVRAVAPSSHRARWSGPRVRAGPRKGVNSSSASDLVMATRCRRASAFVASPNSAPRVWRAVGSAGR